MAGYNSTETLGQRIGRLRTEKGESQEALGQAVGEARETIKNWEAGTRKIKAEAIIKLSQHFCVSADYLLGLSKTKSTENDIKIACQTTGLSEKAIYNIRNFTQEPLYILNNEYGEWTYPEGLNLILESETLAVILEDIYKAQVRAKCAIDNTTQPQATNHTPFPKLSPQEQEGFLQYMYQNGMTPVPHFEAASHAVHDASDAFQLLLHEEILTPMWEAIKT